MTHTATPSSRHRVDGVEVVIREVPRNLISTQVVKIDIDTPAVELAIVEAIAERPEIAALIDELYFEYHFYFDGMGFGWGPAAAVSGDVDTAMDLFQSS